MVKAKKIFADATHFVKIFLFRWGILVFAAILLTWYLQYRYFHNSPDETWQFLDEHAKAFWYTSFIVFFALLFIYGITRKPFVSIAILFAFITIFGYVNIAKFEFRGSPLLPEDFQLADQTGTLTKFIDVGALVRTILAVVLSLLLGAILDYLTTPYLRYLPKLPKLRGKKKPKTKRAKKKYHSLIIRKIVFTAAPRIIIILVSLFALISVTNPIMNHGGKKEDFIPEIGVHFISWSQVENYDENGFLLGFLYNIKKQSVTAPGNYSEKTIADINKNYSKIKKSDDDTSLKNADYNIIIILDESFYDPSIISDYYEVEGVDATPVLHKIQQEYPSGYMYSPDYGGGTANIEFEVLTGLSNYWANTVPYTDILTKISNITSIGKDAKEAGYKTAAIHSFTGEMYKRQIALAKEGFDKFITEEEMTHKDKEGDGDYIKDSELYAEIIDLLEKDGGKQLVFAITMQNHAPYAYGKYPHEDYKFWIPRLADDFDRHASVLSYLQTLYNSDRYLGEFLEKLESSNEKTIVLFFGDHAAGVFPDVHDNSDKSIADLSHLTPYFIWANFKTDNKNDEKISKYAEDFLSRFSVSESFIETAENINLPTTTPNCLTNTMYNLLKIEKDARQNLLDQVCIKTPILAPTYLGGNPPENEKVFKEYELLNYDILGGEQYWLK